MAYNCAMSRTPINIAGQKFGRLTAIREVGSLRKFRVWEFRCDCGVVVERTGVSVRRGSCLSCGCLQSEKISARTTIDIAGEKFGRLTVVRRSGKDRHGKVLWICKCDCGAEKVAVGTALRKGDTRSCGCLHRETVAAIQKGRALPAAVKKENRKASAAKQRAKRRSNPLAVMQARLSRLHRHALAKVGGIKSSPTFDALGYTPQQFVDHIERQFVRGMGWHNMQDWQIDHILPISSAESVEDIVALNQLSNLRPMWARENNAKKNKVQSLL